MSTIETERPQARYALGHSPGEYDRLRTQARVWEDATGKLLDRVGLGPGASCLDAGCGPGETMRLMATREGIFAGFSSGANIAGSCITRSCSCDSVVQPKRFIALRMRRFIDAFAYSRKS